MRKLNLILRELKGTSLIKSCLDELLALRPADDGPETIRAAIHALKAKRAEFEVEAQGLRNKLKKDLLFAAAPEVKLAEARVSELERADAQALDLIGAFTSRWHERDREEAEKKLRDQCQAQRAAEINFAARFPEFYPGLVEVFLEYALENQQLEAQRESLNHKIAAYNRSLPQRKCAPAAELARLLHPLEKTYFDKVFLPKPGLCEGEQNYTPMAHQGAFWQPGMEAGLPPGIQKQIDAVAQENRRREALDASRREAGHAPPDTEHSWTVRLPGGGQRVEDRPPA